MLLIDWLQTYSSFIFWIAGGLLLALWLAVVAWSFRDIRARSRSSLAIVSVVLVVLLFPIFGLVIYLLLRPRQTLSESYDRALEQEALLQQIEDKHVCPTCSRPTQANWFLCPHCHTHLRHPCPVCNSPLELHWDICPYCGYLFQQGLADDIDPATDTPVYLSHQPDDNSRDSMPQASDRYAEDETNYQGEKD